MAAPSQRMASQASPKAAVRDAKEARNARIRRSASFRSSITETLSPLEQLHLPIGFASVPPDHHSKRDSRNSLDDVAEVHVEARKIVVSDCVAHGVRAPGARDGMVLVADGSRSPRAMKLFRVMRGDYLKRPWDAAPHLLPDLIKQDREPWEDRVANCEKRRRELERAFRAKTLHELGRDDRRRARAARAHKDAALLRMVALGARAELMKGELLRDRREAAEEEDDDQEEQAVAATPSPKKRSRRRDRRRAAEALTGDASTKIGRWWLGLKIRWLLNGISIARRVRVTLTVTKITQQIIAKYRNRVYRRSADIIHHFLVKAEKCQAVWKSKFYGAFVLNHRVVLHAIDATPARWRGNAGSSPLDRARCQGKRGMKLLVRKIKLAQRMVRGWVATRQARIAALHRAFALAEIDFQHELDRRRVEVEVHAIRRTSHPDSMFYAVWKSKFYGAFYDRAQALATADHRLQAILPIEGNSLVAQVLRRAEIRSRDPERASRELKAEVIVDDPYHHAVFSRKERTRTVEEVLRRVRRWHGTHAVEAYEKYLQKCHEVRADDVRAMLAKPGRLTRQDTLDVLQRPADKVSRYPMFRPLTGPHNILEEMRAELERVHSWRHPPRKERSKRKRAARVIQARWRGTELKPEVDRDALEAIFTDFCRVYRMADMNNTIWAKLCRETKGLLDDKFTRDSGIDMVWTRCAKTNKTVGFPVFEHMLREVAGLKGMDLFQLESLVVENAKVKQSGTKAQNVKFYEVPKPKTTKGDQIDLASMTNTGR